MLPSPLLNSLRIQVMLMMREEFEDLQQSLSDEEKAAQEAQPAQAGASTSQGAQQGEQQAVRRKPLLLGTDLMHADGDFAELVSLTLIQVRVRMCMFMCVQHLFSA